MRRWYLAGAGGSMPRVLGLVRSVIKFLSGGGSSQTGREHRRRAGRPTAGCYCTLTRHLVAVSKFLHTLELA